MASDFSPQTDKIFPASLETTLIKTPVPGLSVNPIRTRIVYKYNPQIDEIELNNNLRIPDHLSLPLQRRCKDFVIEFFDHFREEGV